MNDAAASLVSLMLGGSTCLEEISLDFGVSEVMALEIGHQVIDYRAYADYAHNGTSLGWVCRSRAGIPLPKSVPSVRSLYLKDLYATWTDLKAFLKLFRSSAEEVTLRKQLP